MKLSMTTSWNATKYRVILTNWKTLWKMKGILRHSKEKVAIKSFRVKYPFKARTLLAECLYLECPALVSWFRSRILSCFSETRCDAVQTGYWLLVTFSSWALALISSLIITWRKTTHQYKSINQSFSPSMRNVHNTLIRVQMRSLLDCVCHKSPRDTKPSQCCIE